MNCKILFFTSLFFISIRVWGQSGTYAAGQLIAKADSVILISHLTTQEYHDKREGIISPADIVDSTNGIFPSFFVGKDINSLIIVQKKLLTKQEVASLIYIIQKPVKKSNIGSVSLCFEPHHAVLIYSRHQLSYIEFCFHCSDLVTSKDLKLKNSDFKDGKWKDIKAFFYEHGLTYEIDGKN